ncbi:sensor histidine kinase [Paenibacillus ehimensis]|uniref:histidine kinase n=1 Tax=Paenibacillus ehimensis TaxID=79264 RepID=A0ABT8V5A8_9BACL|nr:ATP-binding protein [Paenibacillus ehimensis]MDO3676621.1 ATP-binding protein [Paenibacillus ehimensis]
MRGLYAKFALVFIGLACGILIMALTVLLVQAHRHFMMYQQQTAATADMMAFNAHLEQALVQSVVWIAAGGIVLAALAGLYAAKRMAAPLMAMKAMAVRMAGGELGARTEVRGNDELADLAQAINALAAQLEKQEHLRKTMTADVAHELRTPLATLKSHMEAMMDGVWEPTQVRLAACHEEVERLSHLVGDLEQLTQMDSPHFRLRLQTEDLAAVAAQSVEAVKAAFAQKKVALRLAAPAQPVLVQADRRRIGQILANVLSNAWKYTPSGGQVEVKVEQDDGEARVVVADTGIGIPAGELPYVFERFYRTDKSRNRSTGGSGIGLTIARRLAEAHGGRMEIESEAGRGTTVRICFPG